MSNAGYQPSTPAGIEILTPPREHDTSVQCLNIPWFEFGMLVESQIRRLRLLSQGRHAIPSLSYEETAERSRGLLMRNPSTQVTVATDRYLHQPTAFNSQIGDAAQGFRYQWAQDPNFLLVREDHPGIIAASFQEYHSKIASRLDNIMIERQDGDITKALQASCGSSEFETTFQLLRYSIYLFSNNLLHEHQADELLKWAIEQIIKLKTATIEIFASNILLSATRICSLTTMRALVALGINVNILAGPYPKQTALLVAVREAVMEKHCRSQEEGFPLVVLLLNAGADINAKSGHENTSPLQIAVSSKKVELTQTLLNYGAAVNTRTSWQQTFLNAASNSGSHSAERILEEVELQKLVHRPPLMITHLQDAAMWHNVDTVKYILGEGADVNAPAGIAYEALRKAAVNSNSIKYLQSAIQFAALQGKTDVVQVLVAAGADPNGYSLTPEEYRIREHITGKNSKSTYELGDDYIHKDNDGLELNFNLLFRYPRLHWAPLQSAADRQDVVLVQMLLLAGANVEGYDLGPTHLQLAALRDNAELVKLLLENRANINAAARGCNGKTALQAAVQNRNNDLIEVFLFDVANLNATASLRSGHSAFQAAVQAKDVKLVIQLLSLGADVNAAISLINGRTCLQAAAEIGHSKLVQILLNSGAAVNAPSAGEYPYNALQGAARNKHLSVVKILLAAGADVNLPASKTCCSALSAAVMGNNLAIVQMLSKTANPNGQGHGILPLFLASRRGASEMVQCLIGPGANVNALCDKPLLKYNDACTALEVALVHGHEDTACILLNASVHIRGQVPNLQAALGAAIIGLFPQSNRSHNPLIPDIIHKLLNAGADPNRVYSHDRLPLLEAVKVGSFELIQIFLDVRADVNGKTQDGQTALNRAVYQGNIDIVQILLNAEADINIPAPRLWGRTALQRAVEQGRTHLVQLLLLEQGADCNAPAAEWQGVTALQAAAIKGRRPLILILLQAGANINAPAAKNFGRTALEGAAEHGRLDIVSFLLKNDTNVEGLESSCKSAASLAEENGHVLISRMLRDYKKG